MSALPIQNIPQHSSSWHQIVLQQMSGPILLLSKEWEEYVDPVTGKTQQGHEECEYQPPVELSLLAICHLRDLNIPDARIVP